jgi:hypothetical protein
MKILLHIFLYSLFTCSAAAQTVEVSNPTKLTAKSSKFKVIGKNSDGYIVRLYGSQDVIEVYSDDLRLVTSRTIEFKTQDGPLQHILLNKTGAVIFFLTQDKKFSVLMAQPVNSKFVEIGKPIAIDTIYDRRDLIASNLRFKASNDQNFLFVYYPFFKGSNVESVKMLCLNNSLNQLFNRTMIINRNESELESSRTLIDNNGNCYIVFRDMQNSAQEDVRFNVFRVSETGELGNYTINCGKQLFGDPYIEVDNKNGNLVWSGFYNDDKRKEDVATGIFYGRLEPATGAEQKLQHIPFSKDFITELTGREASENKLKLYTFNVKRVMLRNDGGTLFLAESFIRDSREQVTSAGMQAGLSGFRTITLFQYNDIIAYSVDSTGAVSWNAVMRKKQVSEEDNGAYSSFLIVNQKEQLRFIYLDEITYQADLNEYTLTSDGRNKRTKILNQEESDLMLMPKMGKQVSPNEVLVPSYKNGALRLVKISY